MKYLTALARNRRGRDSEAKLWKEEVAREKDNKKKMIAGVLKKILLTAADLSKDNRLNHNYVSSSAIQRILNEEGLKAWALKRCIQISN